MDLQQLVIRLDYLVILEIAVLTQLDILLVVIILMYSYLQQMTKHTQHLSLIHISEPTRPY